MTKLGLCAALFAALAFVVACGSAPLGVPAVETEPDSGPGQEIRPTVPTPQPDARETADAAPPPATPDANPHHACPTDRACRVMPLGDSITQGYGSTDGAGYRRELFHLLTQNGHDVVFVGGGMPAAGPAEVDGVPFPVAHEGHIGFQTFEVAALLDASLATYRPDVVLLMIGTNDVSHGNAAAAPGGIASLVDQVHRGAPLATVVLSTVIPTGDAATTALVANVNAELPGIVAARSEYCRAVDSFAAFVAEPGYAAKFLIDGIHPNDAGYVAMASTWMTALGGVW